MTESDKRALQRLAGGDAGPRASVDDLQGLLLQVVFALLMIFMIACFLFVKTTKKAQEEQVLDLTRQKLVLALEKTAEDRRIRYGLNALMTQGTDGSRTFEPDECVQGGAIRLAPAAKSAFASGCRAAFSDYSDASANMASWRADVFSSAQLSEGDLDDGLRQWLDGAIATSVENVRLDVRGVQRSLAARLQRQWIENPSSLGDLGDAGEIADRLKKESLRLVSEAAESEVLP